jgi:hypothetical protein
MNAEAIHKAIWSDWSCPISKLDVAWFAGEVERRLLELGVGSGLGSDSAPVSESEHQQENCPVCIAAKEHALASTPTEPAAKEGE